MFSVPVLITSVLLFLIIVRKYVIKCPVITL